MNTTSFFDPLGLAQDPSKVLGAIQSALPPATSLPGVFRKSPDEQVFVQLNDPPRLGDLATDPVRLTVQITGDQTVPGRYTELVAANPQLVTHPVQVSPDGKTATTPPVQMRVAIPKSWNVYLSDTTPMMLGKGVPFAARPAGAPPFPTVPSVPFPTLPTPGTPAGPFPSPADFLKSLGLPPLVAPGTPVGTTPGVPPIFTQQPPVTQKSADSNTALLVGLGLAAVAAVAIGVVATKNKKKVRRR